MGHSESAAPGWDAPAGHQTPRGTHQRTGRPTGLRGSRPGWVIMKNTQDCSRGLPQIQPAPRKRLCKPHPLKAVDPGSEPTVSAPPEHGSHGGDRDQDGRGAFTPGHDTPHPLTPPLPLLRDSHCSGPSARKQYFFLLLPRKQPMNLAHPDKPQPNPKCLRSTSQSPSLGVQPTPGMAEASVLPHTD